MTTLKDVAVEQPQRSAPPDDIPPVLHLALLPIRVLLLVASTAAFLLVISLSTLLHLCAWIPGVAAAAGWLRARCHGLVARLGRRALVDPRDAPILAAALSIGATVLPVFVAQLVLLEINWYLLLAFYVFVYGPQLRGSVRTINSWHLEIHRPGGILKGPSPCERVLGSTFLALLFTLPTGQVEFGVAHAAQHHREDAGRGDAFGSSAYDHASLREFFRYLQTHALYMFFLISPYLYFRRCGRNDLAVALIKVNLVYFAFAAAVALYSWQIAVLYVLIPRLATSFLFRLGDWIQHPFYGGGVDGESYLANTATLLDDPTDFVNEGYHLTHHHRPGAHWSERPRLFAAMHDEMKAAGSIVFRGIGVADLFLHLTVLRNFDRLAHKFEPWEPMTHAEKVAYLKLRSQPLPVASYAGILTDDVAALPQS